MEKHTISSYFKLDGLGGFLIAVGGLLATAAILMTYAIIVQRQEATNYYTIDTNIEAIKADSATNVDYYSLTKDK